jgi:hypothetical protein
MRRSPARLVEREVILLPFLLHCEKYARRIVHTGT